MAAKPWSYTAGRCQRLENMDSRNSININHGVGENKHHLEWCPKYRFEALRSPYIAHEMQGILEQIAYEKGIIVHKIVVD